MTSLEHPNPDIKRTITSQPANVVTQPAQRPLSNYSLSSVCPACSNPTIRLACKVRCEHCGFMWDCSEL